MCQQYSTKLLDHLGTQLTNSLLIKQCCTMSCTSIYGCNALRALSQGRLIPTIMHAASYSIIIDIASTFTSTLLLGFKFIIIEIK